MKFEKVDISGYRIRAWLDRGGEEVTGEEKGEIGRDCTADRVAWRTTSTD